MARPREFEKDDVLDKATQVFWAKGFAATSTDDLLKAMGISRQSLYNAFGDKKRLYREALQAYQQKTMSGHIKRLTAARSPLDGIRNLLVGLVHPNDDQRALGCMGIGSVGEFGATDPDLAALRRISGAALDQQLAARVREGQALGEIDPGVDPSDAAGFIQTTMAGLQIAARGGGRMEDLNRMANFAVDRLRARPATRSHG